MAKGYIYIKVIFLVFTMKCNICDNKVQETFLGKIIGTFVRKDGKKRVVCRECQSKLTKEEIFEKI